MPHANKRHLVVLGTGFAAISLLKHVDLDHYDITVISPRNHFLFTPLLPSTTAGKIEFRSIIEPVRTTRKGIEYFQAQCTGIDPEARAVSCLGSDGETSFTVSYDMLVVSVGAWNNTFGIPGVREHAYFLKELTDARNIRERVIYCLEQAGLPGISEEERQRLLHFVVVGGGPTGVEFAAELEDMFEEDLRKSFPDLVGKVKITLFEASRTILNSFDASLRNYTQEHFHKEGITVRLESPVEEVGEGYLKLKSGEVVPTGLIVWSTGYGPTGLVRDMPFEKDRAGRILTDDRFRIPSNPEIFAVGDCASVAGAALPQTAQLAMQEGKHLSRILNDIARGKEPKAFRFKNLGMLAYIGEGKALADLPRIHWRGFSTYVFWRSAYLTRLVSLKNKVLVVFDWIKTWIFGRDMSRF